MAILGHDRIEELIKTEKLIEVEDGDMDDIIGQIQPASYDLRVGSEYYRNGRVHKLERGLEIRPYELVIVTSHEKMSIPKNVAGRFQISAGLSLRGIMAVTGLQLDPGWQGRLFLPLFNLSNTPIHLRPKEHYATLEFSDTAGATEYDGHYDKKFSMLDPDVLPQYPIRSGLLELLRRTEESHKRIERLTQVFYVIAAIMIAVMGVMMAAVFELLRR